MACSWKFIVMPRMGKLQQTWSWVQCRDGCGVRQSDRKFITFLSCVGDARLVGFGVTDSFDIITERRKMPRELPRGGPASPNGTGGVA